jgi:hypothetical protein
MTADGFTARKIITECSLLAAGIFRLPEEPKMPDDKVST